MTWVTSASRLTPVSAHSSSKGAAVEMDHRRQLARHPIALLADRPAGVEAGQLERILDAELCQHLVLGEFVDPQHDVLQMAAEMLGHAGDRRLGQPLDLGRVGREGLTLPHRGAT